MYASLFLAFLLLIDLFLRKNVVFICIYIGPLYIELFMEKRAKKLSNA